MTLTDLFLRRLGHAPHITRMFDRLRIKVRRLGLWLTLMGS